MDCVPDTAVMKGSVRYVSLDIFESFKLEITKLCTSFSNTLNCTVETFVFPEYPPVRNHFD